MNIRTTSFTAVAVIATTAATAQLPAQAISLTGLTSNNTLVHFDSASPDSSTNVSVTGLEKGFLQGIDFRPADGKLYGVTDTDKVYTINPNNGKATLKSTLSTSFDAGFQSGMDFNPVLDALRLNGSNDQNFGTNVDTGVATPQTELAYTTTDIGVDPNITAAAYTQSFLGPPDPTRTTQLYGIDYNLDTLVLQNPPPTGNLTTIGSLGFNFTPIGGFDIYTDSDGKDSAYALSGSSLYTIDLATGAAVSKGPVSGAEGSFIGLAAKPVPEPSSILGILAFSALSGSLLKRKRQQNA